ncbi:CPBP family intramembrane glutamic endopeptidase [Pilimelia columellifera]|uniref:CAAX prenyl protease 2/Lysostaphin resistance protein A-like domain-containing protein n=1 Tax=Pilimelia columellifera subsp. columellifera TaxID=706583 RepID=A0ABN3NS62_9ACTN
MTIVTSPPAARLPLLVRLPLYLVLVVGVVMGTVLLLFRPGVSQLQQIPITVVVLAAVVAVTYVFRRYVDRRSWLLLGVTTPSRMRWWELGAGFVIGSVAVAAVLVAQLAVGVEVAFVGTSAASVGTGSALLTLVAGAVLVALKAAVEEVAFRGYLVANLATRLSWPVAAVIGGVIFTLAHLPGGVSGPWFFGEAIVEYTAWGCLLTWAWRSTGSLWAPTGIHAGWNWAQDYLLGTGAWALPDFGHSLLHLRAAGPTWLIGGPGNMDGSAMVVVQMAVIAAGVALLGRRAVGRGRMGDTGAQS